MNFKLATYANFVVRYKYASLYATIKFGPGSSVGKLKSMESSKPVNINTFACIKH